METNKNKLLLSRVLKKFSSIIAALFGTKISRKFVQLQSYCGYEKFLDYIEGQCTYGNHPFYYNMLRISGPQMQSLHHRIFEQDCFGFQWVGKEDPVVVEIGAHLGHFSRYCLQTKPNAQVIAFEPDRENFSLLEKNLSFYSSAKAEWLAISDCENELDFFVSDKVDWRSTLLIKESFLDNQRISKDEYASSYKVQTIPLDRYYEENNVKGLDHLVITVPGEIENLILEGAYNTISKYRPIVALSVYDKNKEIIDDFFFNKIGHYQKQASPWSGNVNFELYSPED